jgi:hypothetical protein
MAVSGCEFAAVFLILSPPGKCLTPPCRPISIIVVRFSAVPGHVVTAIQSTVGMSIWIYSIAMSVPAFSCPPCASGRAR